MRITVSALRKRLGEPWVIATVPGVGYRIDPSKRGPGFGISFLCSVALLVMAIVGVIRQG